MKIKTKKNESFILNLKEKLMKIRNASRFYIWGKKFPLRKKKVIYNMSSSKKHNKKQIRKVFAI